MFHGYGEVPVWSGSSSVARVASVGRLAFVLGLFQIGDFALRALSRN